MENTVSRIIGSLYEKYRSCREGKVADYIPELTKANPDWFGICVYTADGHGYAIGDTDQPFTIQSISKAFTYGLVLDTHGIEVVEKHIGVEPSGEAFNSISLDPATGRPCNPMINAGAIAATGMVRGDGFADRFEHVRRSLSEFAGCELGVDEDVYRSESATGFRNRAIAHLLRNFNIIGDPVDETLEIYFKQCSVLVTCRNLAVMAATLANGGVNPVTGARVLKAENVEKVLSVMSTCGMYDYSGEWIFTVGLPAKSGVGGGVIGVLPGQLGVAVFSPPLDAKGNSVRGVRTFKELSRLFNLHLFNAPALSDHSIRRVYNLSDVGSPRQRLSSHHEVIRRFGHSVTVVEMQGDFFFSAIERFVRAQSECAAQTEVFVLDFRRVGLSDRASENLLLQLAAELTEAGKQLIVVDPKFILDRLRFDSESVAVVFADALDEALEWCENRIIASHVPPPMVNGLVPFHEFEIFRSLASRELSQIEGLLEMESFESGRKIIAQGGEPDHIYLLAKGSVSIFHTSQNGSEKRQLIAAYGPGVCFGDLAVIDGSRRSADVWTDENSTCYMLSSANLSSLERESSALYARIIRNILLINISRLRRCNQEIGSLKS